MIEERLLNLKSASEILGINQQTLRNWDNRGLIRAVRMPNNYRMIPETEVVRLLNGEKEQSKPFLTTKEKVEYATKEILSTTEVKHPKLLTRLIMDMGLVLTHKEIVSNLELLTLTKCIVKDEKGVLKYVGGEKTKDEN